MKVATWSVAVITLLVGLVGAIGYVLPQNHVAARDALVSAQPAVLFDLIVDVSKYPQWRPDVTRVDILARAPLKWRQYVGSDVITFEVVESRSPERLRVRIADPDLPFGGTWTYDLAPQGSGTRLRITEHGEVYNPIFRFVSRFVMGHTSTIDGFVGVLQRRVTGPARRRRSAALRKATAITAEQLPASS
ncbi:MAG: SRPBCC family protein [Acidobacteria bacterium]|nr:SRPBCC family protein [Acidobacteriota bacterium]